MSMSLEIIEEFFPDLVSSHCHKSMAADVLNEDNQQLYQIMANRSKFRGGSRGQAETQAKVGGRGLGT
jgi:hypothetical protein